MSNWLRKFRNLILQRKIYFRKELFLGFIFLEKEKKTKENY